jgi:hypothetical protein
LKTNEYKLPKYKQIIVLVENITVEEELNIGNQLLPK